MVIDEGSLTRKKKINEISRIFFSDWSDLETDIGYALLRWLYTDVIDLQHDTLALGLLRAAHRFQLPGLLGLCERALVSSVGVRSCVRFYCVAEEVGASSLLEYCSGLISTHWDDLTPQDFEHMTSPLLYKMLKAKSKKLTDFEFSFEMRISFRRLNRKSKLFLIHFHPGNHPLHVAVRLMREDVVFLCLVENDQSVSRVSIFHVYSPSTENTFITFSGNSLSLPRRKNKQISIITFISSKLQSTEHSIKSKLRFELTKLS